MFQWLCRKKINGFTALNKRLNADLQETCDELEKLKADHHHLVCRASLEAAAIPFYENRIAELEATLREFAYSYVNYGEDDPEMIKIAESILNTDTQKD